MLLLLPLAVMMRVDQKIALTLLQDIMPQISLILTETISSLCTNHGTLPKVNNI